MGRLKVSVGYHVSCFFAGDASGEDDSLGSGNDEDDDDEEMTEVYVDDGCRGSLQFVSLRAIRTAVTQRSSDRSVSSQACENITPRQLGRELMRHLEYLGPQHNLDVSPEREMPRHAPHEQTLRHIWVSPPKAGFVFFPAVCSFHAVSPWRFAGQEPSFWLLSQLPRDRGSLLVQDRC